MQLHDSVFYDAGVGKSRTGLSSWSYEETRSRVSGGR